MKLDSILDKEDRELLCKDISSDVECPQCKTVWHSPFPNTRKVCDKCFEELTGYKYTV